MARGFREVAVTVVACSVGFVAASVLTVGAIVVHASRWWTRRAASRAARR